MRRIDRHLFAASAAGWLPVRNPSSSEVIAEVAQTDPDAMEQALQQAYQKFQDRQAWLPLHQRVKILRSCAALMLEEEEALATLIATEGGKPLTDARVEAKRAVLGVQRCAEVVSARAGDVIALGAAVASSKRMAFTQREPIGVVLALSAFNHPLNLIVHQVATAIAAGCPVLIKPASDTPLSCIRFIELLSVAGLPDGWACILIPQDHEQLTPLIKDARIAFLSFIGSADVGWSLRAQLAPGTRCALEHGGVAPVILTRHANLQDAAKKLCKGGYYHAGQVCVSSQRLFVQREIHADFLDALRAEASTLRTGDALLPETDVGPLIRPRECQRVAEWVSEAMAASPHCCIYGGTPLGPNFYAPTLLNAPAATARVSREEIFGPVLCVYPFDEIPEALKAANALPYAFQAAVFTDRLEEVTTIFQHIAASALMVNDHTAFRDDGMPFAGLRHSGLGVGGIDHTIADMQIEKMLVLPTPL